MPFICKDVSNLPLHSVSQGLTVCREIGGFFSSYLGPVVIRSPAGTALAKDQRPEESRPAAGARLLFFAPKSSPQSY